MINIKSLLKKNFGIILFVVKVIICVILLLNTESTILKQINRAGHSFLSIFQVGLSGLTELIAKPFKSFGDIKSLKQEISRINSQLMDFKKIKDENSDLLVENKRLRDQLNAYDSVLSLFDGDVELVSAEIIAKDPSSFFSTFIINKSRNDGVIEGAAVVASYGGYLGLAGKIVTAGSSASVVMPVYNTSFYAAALFQTSYYEGLINGRGESSRDLIMRYVHKQAKEDIKYGDMILTSGLGGTYPRGIPIGTVKKISSKTYETSMEIEVEPVVNLSRVKYIFVIKNREKDARTN